MADLLTWINTPFIKFLCIVVITDTTKFWWNKKSSRTLNFKELWLLQRTLLVALKRLPYNYLNNSPARPLICQSLYHFIHAKLQFTVLVQFCIFAYFFLVFIYIPVLEWKVTDFKMLQLAQTLGVNLWIVF